MLLQKGENLEKGKDCLHHIQNLLRKRLPRCRAGAKHKQLYRLAMYMCAAVHELCLLKPCTSGCPNPMRPLSALSAGLLSKTLSSG